MSKIPSSENDTGLKILYQMVTNYVISSEFGQKRYKELAKIFPDILKELGIKIKSDDKILVLMAGTCIDAFALLKNFKCKVVCVEAVEEHLKIAEKIAKRMDLKDKMTFLAIDVRDVEKLKRECSEINKEYNGVLIWGSSLTHLSLWDFDKLCGIIGNLLVDDGWLLIDQYDFIRDFIERGHQVVYAEQLKPPTLAFHLRYNWEEGCEERVYIGLTDDEPINIRAVYVKKYVWTPWLIKFVLYKNGFENVVIKKVPMFVNVLVSARNRKRNNLQ